LLEGKSVGETEFKYKIDTELSEGNLKFLTEYLRRHYLLQHKKYRTFKDIRVTTEDEKHGLSYRVLVPETNQYVGVTVDASIPIGVTMKLRDSSIPKSFFHAGGKDSS